MLDRRLLFCPGSNDFAFEHRHAVVEFLDRKRIKVLGDHRGERIARRVRENLVDVHREDR